MDLFFSHYWDAAEIGVRYSKGRQMQVRHVWMPHSLGTLKKGNVAKERWAHLRIDERIAVEKKLNSLLVLSVDNSQDDLAGELQRLIDACGTRSHMALVGSIWDWLPALCAITDVYCTPSIMEGFGMSAQEAAATGVPVVASHLVPFVAEYLLGPEVKEVWPDPDSVFPLRQGSGAIVVQAGDTNGFAHALELLLANDDTRSAMGQSAYRITIPYFTWLNMVRLFPEEIDPRPDN